MEEQIGTVRGDIQREIESVKADLQKLPELEKRMAALNVKLEMWLKSQKAPEGS